MSKIVVQQMKVVLCTNQRQKVSGASVASGVAMPFWLAGLIEAAPVAGLIVVGVGGVLLVGYLIYNSREDQEESKDEDSDSKEQRDEKTAREIIGEEKKGAINREFPEEWKDATLGEIEKAAKNGDKSVQKVKKLLNDKRFDKKDNRK